jgi:hypothetical protein
LFNKRCVGVHLRGDDGGRGGSCDDRRHGRIVVLVLRQMRITSLGVVKMRRIL